MRRSIVLLLFATVSAATAVPPPSNDFIGVTVDPEGWWSCADAPAFQTTDLYLVVYAPTRDVASVSATLRIETDVTYYGEWAALDGWENRAEPPDFDLAPLAPVGPGGLVPVASIPLTPTQVQSPIWIHIDPPEGEAWPHYTASDGEVVPLARQWDDGWDGIVNSGSGCHYPPANDPMTWSAVKALYR